MQKILASVTILLLVGMVFVRISLLKKQGVDAMHFGNLDKKDYLIPPFVLYYFYQIFAGAYGLPGALKQRFFSSELIAWAGVFLCLMGLIFFLYTILSFGSSFRVGIDITKPDKLVTTGAFAVSRNPLYVAFWSVILGQFLIFPGWIYLLYLGAATWLFHRQVLREEVFLEEHYGQEFQEYRGRVRRYI